MPGKKRKGSKKGGPSSPSSVPIHDSSQANGADINRGRRFDEPTIKRTPKKNKTKGVKNIAQRRKKK